MVSVIGKVIYVLIIYLGTVIAHKNLIQSCSCIKVQGQISLLCGGVLSFGLAHYSMSEFELLAEELLMSDSVIRVSDSFLCCMENLMELLTN